MGGVKNFVWSYFFSDMKYRNIFFWINGVFGGGNLTSNTDIFQFFLLPIFLFLLLPYTSITFLLVRPKHLIASTTIVIFSLFIIEKFVQKFFVDNFCYKTQNKLSNHFSILQKDIHSFFSNHKISSACSSY